MYKVYVNTHSLLKIKYRFQQCQKVLTPPQVSYKGYIFLPSHIWLKRRPASSGLEFTTFDLTDVLDLLLQFYPIAQNPLSVRSEQQHRESKNHRMAVQVPLSFLIQAHCRSLCWLMPKPTKPQRPCCHHWSLMLRTPVTLSCHWPHQTCFLALSSYVALALGRKHHFLKVFVITWQGIAS